MSTKAEYAACVLRFFDLEPINPNDMSWFVEGSQGCYVGPSRYRAPGYLEGFNVGHNTPFALSKTWWGWEVVYDFATLQRQSFTYTSYWGHGEDTSLSVSVSQYIGVVKGFKNSVKDDRLYNIDDDYRGISESWSLGVSQVVGIGAGYFESPVDPLIRGGIIYGSYSVGLLGEFLDLGYRLNNYTPWAYRGEQLRPWNYVLSDGVVDLGRLQSDIRSGHNSPLFELAGVHLANREYQANLAAKYVFAYQALRYQQVIGW